MRIGCDRHSSSKNRSTQLQFQIIDTVAKEWASDYQYFFLVKIHVSLFLKSMKRNADGAILTNVFYRCARCHDYTTHVFDILNRLLRCSKCMAVYAQVRPAHVSFFFFVRIKNSSELCSMRSSNVDFEQFLLFLLQAWKNSAKWMHQIHFSCVYHRLSQFISGMNNIDLYINRNNNFSIISSFVNISIVVFEWNKTEKLQFVCVFSRKKKSKNVLLHEKKNRFSCM